MENSNDENSNDVMNEDINPDGVQPNDAGAESADSSDTGSSDTGSSDTGSADTALRADAAEETSVPDAVTSDTATADAGIASHPGNTIITDSNSTDSSLSDSNSNVYILGKKAKKPAGKAKKTIIIVAAALIVIVAAGGATYYYSSHHALAVKSFPITDASGQVKSLTTEDMKKELDVTTFYRGITIDGVDISGKTKEEAAAMLAGGDSEAVSKMNISLSVEDKEYPLDLSKATMTSDLTAVLEDAYNYNRTSTKTTEAEAIADRYQTLLLLQKTPKNFDAVNTINTNDVEDAVRSLLEPLKRKAVDAVATSFDTVALAFVIDEYVTGLDIDVDGAINDVKAVIEAKEYDKTISVNVTITEPKVTKAFLESTLGLVSSTTTVTTDKPNRNVNIDLICKAEDGLVLQPGESFNFNDYIGKRTSEKGYKEAPGIYGGTTRLELGGGICQTTGTLFHSVMMADLQVDERHPHSWPSTYVDEGTDATVTWGGSNFQFTNNTEYPIAIHAYYKNLHVTMEIYGRPVADGMTIKIEGKVTGRSGPGATQYVANPNAAAGTKKTERDSHDYISADCYMVYYKDGKEVKRELVYHSIYSGIPAIVSVGVRAADGTICAMDPATGAVNVPAAPTAPPAVTAAPTAETTAETTAAPTA